MSARIAIVGYAQTKQVRVAEQAEVALVQEVVISALKHAGLSGERLRFARLVHQHEAAHVAALKKALGKAAIKSPAFDFADTVTNQDKFKATAQVLEDTGVQAYQGQAAFIKSDAVFKAALSIHPVEARHAAAIRLQNKEEPSPDAFDPSLDEAQVLKAVEPFIA